MLLEFLKVIVKVTKFLRQNVGVWC